MLSSKYGTKTGKYQFCSGRRRARFGLSKVSSMTFARPLGSASGSSRVHRVAAPFSSNSKKRAFVGRRRNHNGSISITLVIVKQVLSQSFFRFFSLHLFRRVVVLLVREARFQLILLGAPKARAKLSHFEFSAIVYALSCASLRLVSDIRFVMFLSRSTDLLFVTTLSLAVANEGRLKARKNAGKERRSSAR